MANQAAGAPASEHEAWTPVGPFAQQ
jgi:hypothetical protein